MYDFIGKRKQQVVEEHSNVSFGGACNTLVCQPPNPYFYTSFTSANLYSSILLALDNAFLGIYIYIYIYIYNV